MNTFFKIIGLLVITSIAGIMGLNGIMSENIGASIASLVLFYGYIYFAFIRKKRAN